VFNGALTRLEASFEQLRRFTADASHELRTPLTAIRSVGEVGLQKTGEVSDYVDIIGSMLEEVSRLTHLVESLLTISRADAGHVPINRADIRLMDLVREAVGLLEVLAEEKNQTLAVEGDPELVISADRLILRQAFVNIIDNAVKYSPLRATIMVIVASVGIGWSQSALFNFDNDAVDKPPTGFTSYATGGGPPGKWLVKEMSDSPSGKHVVEQTDTDSTDTRFPVLIADKGEYADL